MTKPLAVIKQLNESVNLIAFALVVVAGVFAAFNQSQIASNIVSGSLGLLGGKALADAQKEQK